MVIICDLQKSFKPISTAKMLVFVWTLVMISVMVDCKKKMPKCSVCDEIVSNFKRGLESTAKSNYGGGNTNWEEKSLGSYATSEVRLVEIIEQLCSESSKECHSMLEEHEEKLEKYWFKEFGQKKDTDLYEYLCIEHIKACCPENKYGPDCSPCPGDENRPCSGNGKCDGSGTREGKGKCSCNSGYKGTLCNECKDGYFESVKNDTHITCTACDRSCKNTCWEEGPKGCDECKAGWVADEEKGCQDINECDDEPCDENKYCYNTLGSYSCFSCDEACLSCTESGPGACKECAPGYQLNEETKICTDVNECENDPTLCTGENQVCNNTPGSYECGCIDGYQLKDNVCQAVPRERVISSKPLKDGPKLSEEWKKKQARQQEIDWQMFKNNPSVTSHFLVMGLYGVCCFFVRNNTLALSAFSMLIVIHVVWFASSCR